MYTYTIVGGGGGALPTSPHPLNTCSHNRATRRPPHPSNTQQHTTTHNNRQQQTTTQQQYTTALGHIKLPMYQLFLWRLYLIVLRRATSLLGALEGVGPENLDFFGPKWHSLCSCHFRAQKSLDCQGPPLPMPLVMMLHSSKPLCTAP
jgi:hypothetical protein